MAAKGKYTPEITKEIIKYVESGVPKKYASQAVGISEETFYQWIANKPDFAESIKEAEARAVARNVLVVQKASEKNWQASGWWLERRYRDDFALKVEGQTAQQIQNNQFNIFNIDKTKIQGLKERFGEFIKTLPEKDV